MMVKELKAVWDVYQDDLNYDELDIQFKTLSAQFTEVSYIVAYLKRLSEPVRSYFLKL